MTDGVCYFKVFPDDYYPFILDNLPSSKLYKELLHEDTMPGTRMVLPLEEAPPFWRELSKVLCGAEIENTFRSEVGFTGPVRAVARLFRDFKGYKILPHTDSSKKACTAQLYLPSDDTQEDLGTSFYSKNEDGSFKEERKLPFLPNTGYCFKVTNSSWHGTNFQIMTKPRDSLIITYYRAGNGRDHLDRL